MDTAVFEEIVVRIQRLIAGFGRVDLKNHQVFVIRGRPVKNVTSGGDNFAFSDVSQPFFSVPLFRSDPIRSDGEDAILQTPGDHGVGTMGKDEI